MRKYFDSIDKSLEKELPLHVLVRDGFAPVVYISPVDIVKYWRKHGNLIDEVCLL